MIRFFNKTREFLIFHFVFPLSGKIYHIRPTYWYNKIVQLNKLSSNEIVKWQNVNLQRFVLHAYNNTQYYKTLFDKNNLKPEDIKTKEDLYKIPITTKNDIRRNFSEFIPKNITNFHYRKAKTGGTTGEPMRYLMDEDTWGYTTAAKMYYWKKNKSYFLGTHFLAFGSSSLFPEKISFARKLYDILRGEFPYNGININDKTSQSCIELIQKKNIRFIYGYASTLFLFAKYVKEHSINMHFIKGVFTTSEMLTDSYRQLIQEVFDCRVMDCYGARDAGMSAYETDYHQYHVGYNCITQFINQAESKTGPIVSTNFLNYSFPLIRYDFGDEVEMEYDSSKYNGQIITKVIGRSSEVLVLGNGNKLTGPGLSICFLNFDVKAFEVKQISPLEIELSLEVNNELYNKEQELEIRKTIQRYIGDDCTLDVKYVTNFIPNKNGKRSYFIT